MTRLLIALAMLLGCASAHAQNWTTYSLGGQQHYQSDNGWNGNGYSLGGQFHQNFYGPQGQSQHCTSYALGGTVHTNCY